MAKRFALIAASTGAALMALSAFVPTGTAQRDVGLLQPEEAQAQLERATRESQSAEARALRLSREAEQADEAADKTAREAASLAAQVQRAEADISAARARYSLAQTDRAALSQRLSKRQEPLVRLTGALQTTARRPLSLSALQPGSLKDLVYVRAVLDSAVPEIRQRTSALRGELEEGRRLERQAALSLENLREKEQELQSKRAELAQLETRQRLASRDARSSATRESERALALAEEARDLDGLMGEIDAASGLRRELAALSGPVLRPSDLAAATTGSAPVTPDPTPSATPTTASAPPRGFQLPVQGRTIAGFGEMRDSGLRSTGLSLAPAAGAQVVSPAEGRIAFAGPYRGYGSIVIIEHAGGWTSLVTGLARINAEVGDEVIGGSPLGVADTEEPSITIELRREGEAVNPLQFLG
ncbi:murein hydrolase activator EnvC family protein [Erythrobacter crassostreae]|uniref:Peptidoglycan DD-metalloendopeptidase family protein n=1 Tax=Erythrobacter crassostreae TaxID=2828328 RepID=A0A9X1F392_9SPHN|nr:peptidoglycan DD-metalloendopeptidase family protein [Erythrobacter crassostrea]MBV7258528.1 peptidoglycan DD-metalloendopeptidase family protein [Erythrobacter crassostrea]